MAPAAFSWGRMPTGSTGGSRRFFSGDGAGKSPVLRISVVLVRLLGPAGRLSVGGLGPAPARLGRCCLAVRLPGGVLAAAAALALLLGTFQNLIDPLGLGLDVLMP